MFGFSIMARASADRSGHYLSTATPGTDGGDFIRGSLADEVISGRGGNDTIVGGGGDDRLDGGAGDDRLIVRWEDNDSDGLRVNLYGGAGSDTFHFTGVSRAAEVPERDFAVIRDFEPGESIRLDLWIEGADGWLDRLGEDDVTVREITNSRFQVEGLDGGINADDTLVVFTSQPMTVEQIEDSLIFG